METAERLQVRVLSDSEIDIVFDWAQTEVSGRRPRFVASKHVSAARLMQKEGRGHCSTVAACRTNDDGHEACKKKDADTVQQLLLAEQTDDGAAVGLCLPDVAFVPMGLDVDSENSEGDTPLYLGCRSGNRQIVRMVSFPSLRRMPGSALARAAQPDNC